MEHNRAQEPEFVLITALVPLGRRSRVVEASQVALVVKNPPANAGDIRDPGLIPGWEDPLKEEMVTHSSIPA